MAKRRSLLDTLPEVEASAGALTAQAQAVAAQIPHQRARLPLEAILDRLGGDTRPLAPAHVEALVGSIAALGLVQPLVVDRHHRLLAGAHRRAALAQWRAQDPQAFAARYAEGVPVHVYDVDAAAEPQRALAVEVTENEQRRDYTRAEALALARRLEGMGYTYRATPGAPKAGERLLVPALAVLIGKSEKTIRRYLHAAAPATAPTPPSVPAALPRQLRALAAREELPADERATLARAAAICERLRVVAP